jgi:serine/threonine-protein kinase RsbW
MRSSKTWARSASTAALGDSCVYAEETGSSACLRLQLRRDAQAPATARAAVRGWCDERAGSASRRETLLLLVSELVTNAVLHSPAAEESPISFSARVTEQTVRVAVCDGGDGFTPTPRDRETTIGGYGLYLLEREASRWGVDRVGGTRVWFEL